MQAERLPNPQGFVRGLTSGAFGSFVGASAILYVLSRTEHVTFSGRRLPALDSWVDWAYTNLGSSIPVFAALLLAFFVTLGRLHRFLDDRRPINEIVQLDHLTDIWMTLFFGTGVIWTAIGMRSALIFALGEPDETMQQGAFAMLKGCTSRCRSVRPCSRPTNVRRGSIRPACASPWSASRIT
jgi:hypothetical protein